MGTQAPDPCPGPTSNCEPLPQHEAAAAPNLQRAVATPCRAGQTLSPEEGGTPEQFATPSKAGQALSEPEEGSTPEQFATPDGQNLSGPEEGVAPEQSKSGMELDTADGVAEQSLSKLPASNKGAPKDPVNKTQQTQADGLPGHEGQANPGGEDQLDGIAIPEVGDKKAQKPKAGVLRISEQAVKSRMRRLFAPSVNGTHKVPESIIKIWAGKGKGRHNLQVLFQSVGFDKDGGLESCLSLVMCVRLRIAHETRNPWEESFIAEAELLRSDELENALEVEGQFVSEETMLNDWGWSANLRCIERQTS